MSDGKNKPVPLVVHLKTSASLVVGFKLICALLAHTLLATPASAVGDEEKNRFKVSLTAVQLPLLVLVNINCVKVVSISKLLGVYVLLKVLALLPKLPPRPVQIPVLLPLLTLPLIFT